MKKILMIGGCLFALVGCVISQSPPAATSYVAAQEQPSVEPEKVIVEVPTPMPMPGQLQLKPGVDSPESKTDGKKTKAPASVIEGANEGAKRKPNTENYFNSIMQYNYAQGALYQVYAAPLKFTDIQLQPGEELMGSPICGDTVRWIMGLGVSKKDGKELHHIFLKPTESDLHTTFTINTDKRTYHLEIHSYKNTYMAAIKWRYPHDEILQLRTKIQKRRTERDAVISTLVALDKINNNYSIKITSGNKKIQWVPLMVFDDGHKTFIHFPKGMLEREAPVLFVISFEEETQLVNYRVKNNYYIVDRLFSHAELRLGQKSQDVVSITNLGVDEPVYTSSYSFHNTDS
ncbi:MAG: P-type conjugative transfer protein TrbG [Desulfobulbaceae bacterium]|nr:P-type conjugative transfer protein TrbG [Desulfobulbaceae bacterium]